MWTDIHETIRSVKTPFRLQKANDDHWSSISIGRAGFHLNMLLTPRNESIGIDLYITVPWKMTAFNAFLAQRDQIEGEIGETLQWMPLPGKKTARILLEAKIDPRDSKNEQAVRDWFAEYSVKMFNVFKPRVLALKEPVEGDPAELFTEEMNSSETIGD